MEEQEAGMKATIWRCTCRYEGLRNGEESGEGDRSIWVLQFPFVAAGNLGPNDLRAVRRALFSVRSKWYDIGKGLDISPQTLKDIGREYPNNTPACLTKMLKQWLSSTSPLEWHTPPSWNSLVRALLSVPIGEKRLAYDIWKQYCYQDGEQATGPAPGEV